MFPQYDEFGRPINHQIPLPYINQMPVNVSQPIGPTPQPQVSPIPNQIYPQIPEAPIPSVQPVNQPDAMLARVVAPGAMTSQQGIQPVSPLPAQAALEAAPVGSIAVPQRDDPAYRNSRLRTVMNAIAGGLAGAAGGPKAGIEAGSYLHDMKYNRAMNDYTNNLGLQEKKVKSEQERQKVGNLEYLSPYKATALTAKADKDIASVGQTDRKLTAAEEENKSKELRRQVLNEKAQWELANPGRNPLEFKMSLSPEKLKIAEELEKTEAENKANAGIGAKDTALQHSIDIKAEPGNLGKQAATASATGFAGAVARGQGTETAKLNNENLPQNVDRRQQYVAQLHKDPDSFHDTIKLVPKELQPAVMMDFFNSGGNINKKLSPTVTTAVNNSKVALAHAANIEKLFNDPEIQAGLGPISGRLNQIVSAYGGKAPGDQAATEKAGQAITEAGKGLTGKQQQLLGLLAYLVTFEASSASGTRPSWQLIQYLGSRSPQLKFEPDRFKGALEAVKQSAAARITSAYAPSDLGQPTGAAKSTPEDDFWKDIKSKPVVKAPGGKP